MCQSHGSRDPVLRLFYLGGSFPTESSCIRDWRIWSPYYGPVRKAMRGRKSDLLDKLIAAYAIALGATLVTNNERDFVV